MNEIIELKLTNSSSYDLKGYCYFVLKDGNNLKLSYRDCLEIFSTVADVTKVKFDRDVILEEMLDKLGLEG